MPAIQGVILIDVWANAALTGFYHSVAQRVSQFDIRCCVNASYNLDISNARFNHSHSDRSLYNTFRRHLWNRPIQSQPSKLEHLHPSDRLAFNVMRFSRSNYTSDPALCTPDLLGSDASVVILDVDDLVHHCQMYHNNSIKNWLIVGQAWMMCVHFRPMGLYNLRRLAVLNDFQFFVTNWSVLDSAGQELSPRHFDGSDNLKWESVKDFGYRLIG